MISLDLCQYFTIFNKVSKWMDRGEVDHVAEVVSMDILTLVDQLNFSLLKYIITDMNLS